MTTETTSVVTDQTINDLVRRVQDLEARLQDHTGDAQGSSGQFYPHPVQIIDTAEYGGGIMRLDKSGIQVLGTLAGGRPAIFFLPRFSATPTTILPRSIVQGSSINAVADVDVAAISDSSLADGVHFSIAELYGQTNTSGVDSAIIQLALTTLGTQLVLALSKSTTEQYVSISGGPLLLGGSSSDFSPLRDGEQWYRLDIFRPRIRSNGITGNLGIEIQSATAPAIANNGTITTAGVSVARVAPAAAVTGIILAVGTTGGQVCTVVNESAAASTVTFAASGTSNVADGVASVIAGLTARRFTWDSSTALWYPTK